MIIKMIISKIMSNTRTISKDIKYYYYRSDNESDDNNHENNINRVHIITNTCKNKKNDDSSTIQQ